MEREDDFLTKRLLLNQRQRMVEIYAARSEIQQLRTKIQKLENLKNLVRKLPQKLEHKNVYFPLETLPQFKDQEMFFPSKTFQKEFAKFLILTNYHKNLKFKKKYDK